MTNCAPSKTSKSLENNKEKSPERLKSDQEYLDARFLHDRFCKFEIPYSAPLTIKIIRKIAEVISLEALKTGVLGFKLNSLNWFLTEKGKEYLRKQDKRHQLDQKLKQLSFEDNPERNKIKQIAFSGANEYTLPVEAENQSLIDYLS